MKPVVCWRKHSKYIWRVRAKLQTTYLLVLDSPATREDDVVFDLVALELLSPYALIERMVR